MVNEKIQAIDAIQKYNGNNPLLLKLKHNVVDNQNLSVLNKLSIEYILKNTSYVPKTINKIVKISDWLGKKIEEKYNIEFCPEKILIYNLIGEIKDYYHVYGKWRKNMNIIDFFLDKKGVITDFTHDDYRNLEINFDRYNNLLSLKEKNRQIKPHQKEAVKFLLSRKKCILADDMGMGKSMSLSIAAIEGNFDSVLIICPSSLKTNWKNELSWFVPEKDITIIDGFISKTKNELESFLGYKIGKSGLKKNELLKEAKEYGKWQDNRFVIINFEILNEFYSIITAKTEENIEKACAEYPILKYLYKKKSLIIIDEAHNLSNSTSDRYKLIRNLIKKSKPNSIYLSTGTPITNYPINFFNLLQLIDEPIANDWDFFSKRYCNAKKIPLKSEREKYTQIFLKKVRKNSWQSLSYDEKVKLQEFIRKNAKMMTIVNGCSNLDELKEKTAYIYLRREKNDIKEESNLKEKIIKEIVYKFNDKQKEEYDRLWDEYEKAQKDLNPEKNLNKDLMEGIIYRKFCSNEMVPYTIKLADKHIENNEKVVIMCCFDDELYAFKNYYGDKCVIYNGKMNLKEKDKAKELFLNDANKMVFIGNIDAAGAGLTLTSAHIMIFNNISFVPSDNQQAMDRIYRIGQTEDVIIYLQIFKDTQYEKILDTVINKQTNINKVIKKESEK